MKKEIKAVLWLFAAMLFLSGCAYTPPEGNVSYVDISEIVEEEEEVEEEEVEEEEEEDLPTIKVMEGELVKLKLSGTDPDGDPIEYAFSEPLDEDGEWQTEEGDGGEYVVTIVASDGKTTSSKKIKIVVESLNEPPEMDEIDDITVDEGETVELEVFAEDPEGEELTVEVSGWMDSLTKDTNYDDGGTYTVTVTVSDGEKSVSQDVTVTVNEKNRAPRIKGLDDVEVTEGETAELDFEVSDADGDEVETEISGWMDSTEKETSAEDVGEHDVTVAASDGMATVSKTVTITVLSSNAPPVMDKIDDITVDEGETVELEVFAEDPDGDELTIEVSGWMDSLTKETDYDDEGTHTVTVTVSDGQADVSQDVTVTVNDVNRPPEFEIEI
ncbi:PKD domain-containing protein [Candidatus Woesearchaeota archaeon]|nr:PKD domain-containing protein [Candidatus Woesearchaeota archaeon]